MQNQKPIEFLAGALRIPLSLVSSEVEGLYGSQVLREMGEIIGYYNIYEKGSSFKTEGSKGDYVPSNLRFRQAYSLVNKEARFLFSNPPDLWVEVEGEKGGRERKNGTILQNLVDGVLKYNHFNSKLIRAAKDCFIGKRVAYLVNFDEIRGNIKISFIPSLEFVYETDDDDSDEVTKLVIFYTVVDSKSKNDQRIYKKKYWMKEGLCWISEAIYDGLGSLVEEVTPERATRFPYIPAGVIINEGLTGDMFGSSDVSQIDEFESWYSRLSNADMDAERQGMNPIRWARDMAPGSTEGLSIAAGAFWDLATDPSAPEGVSGETGVLETSMGYTQALNSTLSRIKSSMYDTMDMPDVSPESLRGVVSSGKTLKAIYWGLTVRCDEKMLVWRPALEHIAKIIVDGAKMYPQSTRFLNLGPLPDVEFSIRVDNRYSLPEDETEEKETDLAEVNAQTMSKKAYMKKWRNLTDEEIDEELNQMARERELLEDSFSSPFITREGNNNEQT